MIETPSGLVPILFKRCLSISKVLVSAILSSLPLFSTPFFLVTCFFNELLSFFSAFESSFFAIKPNSKRPNTIPTGPPIVKSKAAMRRIAIFFKPDFAFCPKDFFSLEPSAFFSEGIEGSSFEDLCIGISSLVSCSCIFIGY